MINTLGAASVGSAWIPDLLFNLFQLVFAAYFLRWLYLTIVRLQ
jgi:hypothetical protein